jgi:two-component system response regulator FlrC
MIGVLDLGGRGLVSAAAERLGPSLKTIRDPEAAFIALASDDLSCLVIETDTVDATARQVVVAARGRSVPTLLVARDRSVSTAVEALQAGATDYLCSPFELESLHRALNRLVETATANGGSDEGTERFVTQDPGMRATLDLARSLAASDATILIEGESGTGKELLARLIHGASPRHSRDLISVNCAALPSGLLESELFGHERGAFTGAVNRVIGKFELAHGATLLLDEIGELELPLQAKLLRTIQEREVQRLGAPRPVRVDFRLLATTNRDLAAEVRAGRFRQDLYYRLHVLPIRLDPLREHPGDVPVLVETFLKFHTRRGRMVPIFSSEAIEALRRHSWPGNVRELENLIERLVLTRAGQTLSPEDLSFRVSGETPGEERVRRAEQPPFRTLRQMERWMIVETLTRLRGNRTHAARELGISLRTLRNKIHEHEIFEPETLPQTGVGRRASPATRAGQISPGSP